MKRKPHPDEATVDDGNPKRGRSRLHYDPDQDDVAMFEELPPQLPTPPTHPSTPLLQPCSSSEHSRVADDVEETRGGDVRYASSPVESPRSGEPSPELPQAMIYLDNDDDEQADYGLDEDEQRARFAVRLAMRNAEIFDYFRVEAILGFGTSGVVVRARPNREAEAMCGKDIVAIKICYKWIDKVAEAPQDPFLWNDTVEEVAVLEEAKGHQNVLNILRTWEDNFHAYIITELVGTASTSEVRSRLSFYNYKDNTYEDIPVYRSDCDL
ncbi:hypothetical protein HDU96_004976, partial [Phlyctochytrium bullatum]